LGDAANEHYPLVIAKMSLRNTSDTVTLAKPSVGYCETVSWLASQPDGVTLERTNPNKLATPENFGTSKAIGGSTPGRVNSLIPPDHNLGLTADTAGVVVLTDTLKPIVLNLKVKNKGMLTSQSEVMLAYFDRDFSHGVSDGDRIDYIPLPSLLPDSTALIRREYYESSGRKWLCVQLPPDADSTDNALSYTFGFGSHFRELAVSEFLPNPEDLLDCEWIELKNVAHYPVDLRGFAVGTGCSASRSRTPSHSVRLIAQLCARTPPLSVTSMARRDVL